MTSTGTVATGGYGADAIDLLTLEGNATVTSNIVTTQGDYSAGIEAEAIERQRRHHLDQRDHQRQFQLRHLRLFARRQHHHHLEQRPHQRRRQLRHHRHRRRHGDDHLDHCRHHRRQCDRHLRDRVRAPAAAATATRSSCPAASPCSAPMAASPSPAAPSPPAAPAAPASTPSPPAATSRSPAPARSPPAAPARTASSRSARTASPPSTSTMSASPAPARSAIVDHLGDRQHGHGPRPRPVDQRLRDRRPTAPARPRSTPPPAGTIRGAIDLTDDADRVNNAGTVRRDRHQPVRRRHRHLHQHRHDPLDQRRGGVHRARIVHQRRDRPGRAARRRGRRHAERGRRL